MLNEATDINDSGWIVGWADRRPDMAGIQERGSLIQPICSSCLADVNCDGVVDGIDLGTLLANWAM